MSLEKAHQVRARAIALALVSALGPLLVGLIFVPFTFGGGGGGDFLTWLPDGIAAGVALAPTSPVVLRYLDEQDLLTSLPGQTARCPRALPRCPRTPYTPAPRALLPTLH